MHLYRCSYIPFCLFPVRNAAKPCLYKHLPCGSDENIQRQLSIFKKIRDEQLQECNSEALVLGVHLEGTFLNSDKSGIQDKNVFKKPTIENFKALVSKYEDVIKILKM